MPGTPQWRQFLNEKGIIGVVVKLVFTSTSSHAIMEFKKSSSVSSCKSRN